MPTLCPTYHVPVLLNETVDGLNLRPEGTYVDATFGGGGHSREILRRLGPEGRLYGFDQDADARNNVPDDERFTFVAANFRFLPNWMRYHGETEGVDGVLADLGVSSHHFDDETRGFSFRFDAPLDMRMNTRGGITAAEVLNTYDEADLARIFHLFGELKNARRLASAVVKTRGTKPFAEIADLLSCVQPFVPKEREKKDLAKISISELVKRAGVSRAAFYRNYDSKEEILESVFKRSVHNIMEQLSHYDVKTDLYLVWVHLFRAAKKEAKVIQLALDYHLEKIFVQAMQEFLEKYHGKSKGVSSYLHSFWSSAIVSVLLKWIKDGMKVPAEKIADLRLPFFKK